MVGIPSTVDTDAEDVAWALQTADALWKRNERGDAIVWLRRAAQAAGETEDDDRALALARHAAELAEWVSQNPIASGVSGISGLRTGGPPPLPPSSPAARPTSAPPAPPAPPVPAGPDGSDEIAIDIAVDAPAPVGPPSVRAAVSPPIRPPPIATPPPPPPLVTLVAVPVSASVSPAAAVPPVADDASLPEEGPVHVRTAAETHAGMLDPWADDQPAQRRKGAGSHASSSSPPAPASPISRPPTSPPAVAAPRGPLPSNSGVKRLVAGGPPPLHPSAPTRPPVPRSSPSNASIPTRARTSSHSQLPVPPPVVIPAAALDRALPSLPSPPPPRQSAPALPPLPERFRDEAPTNPIGMGGSAPQDSGATPLPPTPVPPPPARTPVPLPGRAQPTGGVDLSQVESLSDLPDDAREAFALAATVHQLARDEEVSSFALAVVLDGAVYLSATIVDAPAGRLETGTVLRSRGTIEPAAPLRLIGASDRAAVATWDEGAVEAAFRTCPWVETELRSAGDRLQAEVGLTMGPLGEGLDLALRSDVTRRMKLRVLGAQEELVARGKPVPGLVVVGGGELEAVDDEGVPSGEVLRAGECLFPSSVFGGAPAPSTVRASKDGALVLIAERGMAQELLVTCPPLLEILAGG